PDAGGCQGGNLQRDGAREVSTSLSRRAQPANRIVANVHQVVMTARNRNYAIEEIANAVTHGLGLALSVAGFAVLLIIALLRGDKWQIAGCAIYGITLVFLYLASTLYHSVKSPRAKQLLKLLDHCAIYFMIAGTYTPFT